MAESDGKALVEGVYPQCQVFLNGQEIGRCSYGYRSFEVSLDGCKINEDNELTVLVEHSNLPDSRWYAGAGIYRLVWLLTGGRRCLPEGGIRIITESLNPPTVKVETEVCGGGDVTITLLDGDDVLAQGQGSHVTLTLPNAKPWSAESPRMYRCRAELKTDSIISDTAEVSFGIRTLAWGKDGFLVNGEKVLLRGGCIHHDHGILGARTFDEAEERRIRRLKEFGFNCVRAAHNPLSRAALEACDKLGMYVMDEAWDMWDKHKNPYDYAGRFSSGWVDDLTDMTRKDFNHPSVILYSIGNEITEPSKPEGVDLAGQLVKKLHQLDDTRPVTAGINLTLLLLASMGIDLTAGGGNTVQNDVSSTDFNKMASEHGERMVQAAASPQADQLSSPVLDLLDIAGYNYAQSRYEMDQQLHPNRLIVGSETYPQDLPKNWKLVERCPNVIGDFMWTAWDYLGEVGIGAWTQDPQDMKFGKEYPWKLADCGVLDICGGETAEAGMAAVVWGARKTPYIAVRPVTQGGKPWARAMWRGSNAIPSWSWNGCEGVETEVEVYTTAETVTLMQNGACIATQSVQDCKAVFTVTYQPGTITAIAAEADGTQTESSLSSAEDDLRITIQPEGTPQQGKLLFVDVNLTDHHQRIISSKDRMLRLTVSGGILLAYGSANAKTAEEFITGQYTTHYGQSLAAIYVTDKTLCISAQGEGVADTHVTLPVKGMDTL